MNTGDRGQPLRLWRNRMVGLAAIVATVGVGTAIVVVSLREGDGSAAVVLGMVLCAAGLVGFWPLIRPWRIDRVGVWLGRRRVVTWPDVTGLDVRSFRTGTGLGPPHVDVIIATREYRAVMSVYSRRDAEGLHAVLSECLPAGVEGITLVPLIPDTWSAMG